MRRTRSAGPPGPAASRPSPGVASGFMAMASGRDGSPDETRSVSVLLTTRLHMLRKREDYAPCGLAPQPLGPQVRDNEFGSIAGLPSPNRHQPFFSAPRRTGEDDAERS